MKFEESLVVELGVGTSSELEDQLLEKAVVEVVVVEGDRLGCSVLEHDCLHRVGAAEHVHKKRQNICVGKQRLDSCTSRRRIDGISIGGKEFFCVLSNASKKCVCCCRDGVDYDVVVVVVEILELS
jgi:hypothetical protein